MNIPLKRRMRIIIVDRRRLRRISVSFLGIWMKHVSIPTSYDILASLYEMFGGKGKPSRQVSLKAITDTKMSEGTPIRDHMIYIIKFFN